MIFFIQIILNTIIKKSMTKIFKSIMNKNEHKISLHLQTVYLDAFEHLDNMLTYMEC